MIAEAKEFRDWAEKQKNLTANMGRVLLEKSATYEKLNYYLNRLDGLDWNTQQMLILVLMDSSLDNRDGAKEALQEIKDKLKEAEND